ncbi:MAG: helix-turn-helix domain-containing protein [Synergistaceae bacterium]|nr:helix-turn-helix domain-containing protein [Synergistaceae bacterium]
MKPSREQIQIIERTIVLCRYVYNLFIAAKRDNFRKSTSVYMTGCNFSKWLNNEYKADNPDKLWIWEV